MTPQARARLIALQELLAKVVRERATAQLVCPWLVAAHDSWRRRAHYYKFRYESDRALNRFEEKRLSLRVADLETKYEDLRQSWLRLKDENRRLRS